MSLASCFAERSVPMLPGDVVRTPDAQFLQGLPGDVYESTTREWIRQAHARIEHLLPPDEPPALLTEDLVLPDGQPRDVYPHFELDPERLRALVGNLHGLAHSAQGSDFGNAHIRPPDPWPGFEQVWIPVTEQISLSGRFAVARDGDGVRTADCLVILPGLFGDDSVLRSRELAEAMHRCGYHVLTVEFRGHGQTEARYPDVGYSFGPLEVDDLKDVNDWLTAKPFVRETGLVGFCWGANLAMLAAWVDSREDEHPNISTAMAPYLDRPDGKRRFRAGIMAFSPTLRFEDIIEGCRQRQSFFKRPDLASVQMIIDQRTRLKGYDGIDGNLRSLIDAEVARTVLQYPGAVEDGLDFLRLSPFRDRSDGDKMARVRVPVLIVHGANDPLARSQEVADFIARTDNPMVAAIILPGGGHVGFAPYARAYYYNLVAGFYDPEHGAAARVSPPQLARSR